LSFQGLDLLVDEKSGDYYFIDCNYFSSFKGLSNKYLAEKFDEFFEKKLAELGDIKEEPKQERRTKKKDEKKNDSLFKFALKKKENKQTGKTE